MELSYVLLFVITAVYSIITRWHAMQIKDLKAHTGFMKDWKDIFDIEDVKKWTKLKLENQEMEHKNALLKYKPVVEKHIESIAERALDMQRKKFSKLQMEGILAIIELTAQNTMPGKRDAYVLKNFPEYAEEVLSIMKESDDELAANML